MADGIEDELARLILESRQLRRRMRQSAAQALAAQRGRGAAQAATPRVTLSDVYAPVTPSFGASRNHRTAGPRGGN